MARGNWKKRGTRRLSLSLSLDARGDLFAILRRRLEEERAESCASSGGIGYFPWEDVACFVDITYSEGTLEIYESQVGLMRVHFILPILLESVAKETRRLWDFVSHERKNKFVLEIFFQPDQTSAEPVGIPELIPSQLDSSSKDWLPFLLDCAGTPSWLIPGLGGRGWIRNAEKSGTELVSSQFQPNREAELNLLLSCHVPRGENVKRGDSKGGRRRRPHQRREGRRRRERHATGHVDPPLVPTILSVPVSLYLFTSRVRSACTPPGYPAATIFRKVGEGFEILILNLYFRSIFQFKFVSIPRD